MQFVAEEWWQQTPVVPFVVIVLRIGSSLVGLRGAPRLQEENRLDRFVPPCPELEAVERRFPQAFRSDLYLPIAVHRDHQIVGKEKKQVEPFFQALSSLPVVQQALTPFSLTGGLRDFTLDDQLQLHNANDTTYSALFVLDANQQRHDLFLDAIDALVEEYLGPDFEVAVGGEPEVNGRLAREGKRQKEGILPIAMLETKKYRRFSGAWAWLGVMTLGVACYLFPFLPIEMRATHYFSAHHPVQQFLRRLEHDFLPMRSYEVLMDGERHALAEANLIGSLSAVPGVERVLEGELPGFPMFAEHGQLRRATVFVSDAALANPARLQNDIENGVRTATDTHTPVFLVGILARLISAQQAINATLKRSPLITGIALTLLFAVLIRSVIGTIAAFVANAFPLAGLVVLQYLLGLPLDLGIVLTYSICLGLAVDDTLHLVFDMRKFGSVSAEAIRSAEVQCGPGIYESSWILAAGFAFLVFSQFLPVRHFGLLATAGVLLALVGDVVMFPSIITRFPRFSSLEARQ